MKLTLSVRSFHVPATPGTRAWPPSSFDADLARHRADLLGEGAERIGHVVNRDG